LRFEIAGGVKAATSADMRVAHEEGPPHNPGASHALAFGVLASPIFMTSSKFASILEPTVSRSIIVDFVLHRLAKYLNIVSDTNVVGAEVVVTTA